jgi:carboxymethylenebutenolidase
MPSGKFVDLGDGLRAYLSLPAGAGPHPAVLVYQEAFGVNAYIQGEADRLAENGYVALAPDFFRGETFGYDEWAKLVPKFTSLTDPVLIADVTAALAYLDAHVSVKHDGYGAIGFCMGGRLTFLSALEFPERFTAIAGFYGGGIGPDEPSFGRPILIGRAASIKASVLLLYGAEDEGITPVEHGRIAQALSEAKVEFGLHVYPGAGHGFASIDRTPSYEPVAAEKAWAEALALFARTLKA